MNGPPETHEYLPRVMAVELTRRCNLNCIHCRAMAGDSAPEGELSLEEYQRLIDDAASFASPIVILTGGEPLLRPDLYDIASYAAGRGLRTAVSTNGVLVDREVARRLLAAGVGVCSVSVDGSGPEVHDDFRKQPGAFEASLRGMRILMDSGVKVQVNSSLTRRNMHDLENIYRLVKRSGAHAWHVFMLVPTGRGAADQELITAEDYERILNRIYEWDRDDDMEIKPTCAPQYYRILRQRAREDGLPVDARHFGLNARTRGCLAGTGFVFISYRGEVYPCGYYPVMAGSIRESPFSKVWQESELFGKLRDFRNYKGACGSCGYIRVCGGCRARAFAVTGDDMDAEPFCAFGAGMGGAALREKERMDKDRTGQLDELDRAILNRIQESVPLKRRPFMALGDEFGVSEEEVIRRVRRMWDLGVVRRLGPIVNYPAWGMSGVLVAARLPRDKTERARAALDSFPEITHAYLRDHEWNLWFTVIAEDEASMDKIIERVREAASLEDVKKLPRLKSFKLGVRFKV